MDCLEYCSERFYEVSENGIPQESDIVAFNSMGMCICASNSSLSRVLQTDDGCLQVCKLSDVWSGVCDKELLPFQPMYIGLSQILSYNLQIPDTYSGTFIELFCRHWSLLGDQSMSK